MPNSRLNRIVIYVATLVIGVTIALVLAPNNRLLVAGSVLLTVPVVDLIARVVRTSRARD